MELRTRTEGKRDDLMTSRFPYKGRSTKQQCQIVGDVRSILTLSPPSKIKHTSVEEKVKKVNLKFLSVHGCNLYMGASKARVWESYCRHM